MQIVERRVYVGPSLYAHFPVIRLTLDLGELEKWPSAKISGFNEKLLQALPSLDQHKCSYDAPGGFVRRLRLEWAESEAQASVRELNGEEVESKG